MEQARNFVCKECSSPVPSGHKFCGTCGAVVPEEVQTGRVEFFSAMQDPGKARLILIRGMNGAEGLSYLLQGDEHVAGREEGPILFPDDAWLSANHANFFYRGEKLVVKDNDSLNGVYVRVSGVAEISFGEHFLCGEQVFRVEEGPVDSAGADASDTYFYSSPRRPSSFRVIQVLEGGVSGMEFCSRDNIARIGREDADLNFPQDVYLSGSHARVEMVGEKLRLVDDHSRNGTYLRIRDEQELAHGDYLFIGHQLLRVEITA